ncbi:MAG: ATP-dependent RecD-like DNA helicase [Planctomycetota bacterium]
MSQKPANQSQPVESDTAWEGTLARFQFRNPDTGFAVVRFESDLDDAFSAVGQLAQLVEGQRVRLHGKRVSHPRFGLQVEVEAAEAVTPSTAEGIVAYLSSGLVKGIGPALAKRLCAAFGADTLRIIADEPERLREVHGLGQKRIDELAAAVRAQQDVQEVLVFLRTHGLGQGLAARIVKHYGRGASALLEANPYRLADDVIGIGFATADRLAQRLGLPADAPERLRAGLQHALGEAARDGHCFVEEGQLCNRTAQLLGGECNVDELPPRIRELAAENRVVIERGGHAADAPTAVYPITLHQAETGCAARLQTLIGETPPELPVTPTQAIDEFESASGLQLPDAQHHALLHALASPVSVITGGPGVGKTTIVRAIAEALSSRGLEVLLAAPTGRAAKRLEESTRQQALTLHRLLEYQPGVHRFLRDDTDPLKGAALVVDETSMLDVQLAYNLLRAVPAGMRLVLVGDQDQLPAVGPGNVLADIIDSGRVPVTSLTEIFRQRGGSDIVTTAHGILRGEVPQKGTPGGDFFFVEARDAAHARELVREIVVHRAPRAFGLNPIADVQVLCPMYRGEAGADAINRELQDALNPSSTELIRGNKRFRVGDKVMQIRNDYDLDVFNGDVGQIVHVDRPGNEVRVRFGSRVVAYASGALDQLISAYAISVHRSQGSEYPAVVIPIVTEHYLMLRRNLLYTAVTRGKKLVVLVGSWRALEMAVGNAQETRRCSALAARLRSPVA